MVLTREDTAASVGPDIDAEAPERAGRWSDLVLRHPFTTVAVVAVGLSLLNLLNDSRVLGLEEIEWHDIVAHALISAVMFGWISITRRSNTGRRTFALIFMGAAGLAWLMSIKFFGELFESQTSVLTTLELFFAVVGIVGITSGWLSWSGEFREAIARLDVSAARYRDLSERDPLTGLLNRRQFDELVPRLVKFEREVSLIVLDLDHFKSVNDTYGHPVGDRVIERVAQVIGARRSGTDFGFRIGGEEFAVLYVQCPHEVAEERAETMRSAMEREGFVTNEGEAFGATVSIGVAHFRRGDDAQRLYERADEALYEAKERGRNRVVVG